MQQEQLNREAVPGRRSSSRSRTMSMYTVMVKQSIFVLPKVSSLLVPWANHAPQDLLVNLLDWLFGPAGSFKQSTDYCHTPLALPAWRWPQSCLLKAYRSWSHLSPPHDPLSISCAPWKLVCTTWCYLHTLTEAFQVLVTEFSSAGSKTSGLLFNVHRLFLRAHSWTTRKRWGANKITWKNAMIGES